MAVMQVNGARPDYVFTSESVSEGHPDKLCDQVSDAILDAILKRNPEGRGAIEVLATTNHITIAGEMRGAGDLGVEEMNEIARGVVKRIGYDQKGFHWKTLEIVNRVHEQSADIAKGVDAAENKEEGAGDQGIMFGFACDETPELMPAPISYANIILKHLSRMRHDGTLPQLGPDAKSQVSLQYIDGKPARTTSVVVSTQHTAEVSHDELTDIIREEVRELFPKGWMPPDEALFVNPCGAFIIGGPDGDTGLTGRKIIVDTYGGAAPHGGGAFSGKDPTKVDRSAAYAARYLAKNVVAAGLASRCLIQLSYAIGVAQPVSFLLSTAGTGKVNERRLEQLLPELMDLRPRGIRTHLGLNRPIYEVTASYGHFGRAPRDTGEFSWERLDLVDALHREFGVSGSVSAAG